jgi:hypothetical protein
VIAPALELEQYEPSEEFPWLRELDGCVPIARWAQEPTWFASVHAQGVPVSPERLDIYPWDEVPLGKPGGPKVWETGLIPSDPREGDRHHQRGIHRSPRCPRRGPGRDGLRPRDPLYSATSGEALM